MPTERTFSIIKPDATRRNLTGAVTKMLEDAGLRVVASKRIHMTKDQAEGFYAVHRERPFFNDLVTFMISGPVVVQVLEGENAVLKNRDVMGATNPENAGPGTIRKELAESIEANTVHGSQNPPPGGPPPPGQPAAWFAPLPRVTSDSPPRLNSRPLKIPPSLMR